MRRAPPIPTASPSQTPHPEKKSKKISIPAPTARILQGSSPSLHQRAGAGPEFDFPNTKTPENMKTLNTQQMAQQAGGMDVTTLLQETYSCALIMFYQLDVPVAEAVYLCMLAEMNTIEG
jgi:hypothetical protein